MSAEDSKQGGDDRDRSTRREYWREKAREKYRAHYTPARSVEMKISEWTVDAQGNKSRTIEGK
jgi:hypothetical protein